MTLLLQEEHLLDCSRKKYCLKFAPSSVWYWGESSHRKRIPHLVPKCKTAVDFKSVDLIFDDLVVIFSIKSLKFLL